MTAGPPRGLDRPLVFLDLETTGATAARDRITEIGVVEIAHGRRVGEWSTLVNPGVAIPPIIQSLTGITDDMVSGAPAFETIAPELARRLEGKVLAAHNARFDYGFLQAEFRRAELQYTAPVLCTVKLSRRLYPEHRRHNLDALMERHGVACRARHRALGDARVLWDLAQAWTQDVGAEALRDAVERLLQSPALPAGLPATVFDDLPDAPGVYTFYGEDGAALYVGRGANLRTRVLSHFSGDGRAKTHARIAREVRRVDWTQTAGELGALIRESRLVNELTPVLNRPRRPASGTCAWRWSPETPEALPELVDVNDLPAGCGDLYGLFRSRAAALSALRALAATHALCLKLIGSEKTEGACYARQIGRCHGACVGAEPRASHALRLGGALARLRTAPWPYSGPIAVRESNGERCELHVLDRWRYLGMARTEAEVHELASAAHEPEFDLDTYRILARFLKSGADVVHLPRRAAQPTH